MKDLKPRRWEVERTPAWLSKYQAILIRWDKQAEHDRGLLWYRRDHRRGGRPEVLRPPSTATPSASTVGGAREYLGERFPV